MATKAEQAHLDAVSALGCIVCGKDGMFTIEAEIHHLKHDPTTGQHLGMSQRASNFHVIPLCPRCHRTGGLGVAYHAGPRSFEAQHGTEIELWHKTQSLLGLEESNDAA